MSLPPLPLHHPPLPPCPTIAPPVKEFPRAALLTIMRQEHTDKIINIQTVSLDSCVMVITLLVKFDMNW